MHISSESHSKGFAIDLPIYNLTDWLDHASAISTDTHSTHTSICVRNGTPERKIFIKIYAKIYVITDLSQIMHCNIIQYDQLGQRHQLILRWEVPKYLVSWAYEQDTFFVPSTSTPYSYYPVICEKVGSEASDYWNSVQITQFKIFGLA